jgi:hypothetical protein
MQFFMLFPMIYKSVTLDKYHRRKTAFHGATEGYLLVGVKKTLFFQKYLERVAKKSDH